MATGEGIVDIFSNPLISTDVIVDTILRKRCNGTVIGEYLGNADDPKAQEALRLFASRTIQQGTFIDELRRFLTYMWLPRDKENAYTVMAVFSEVYKNTNPDCLLPVRDIVALVYSAIILNVDLHNAGVTKKMEQTDFIRNAREAIAFHSVTSIDLAQIYDSVKAKELRCECPAPPRREERSWCTIL